MKEYHVLSLSGGKDSTALAFFIRDNMPEVHEKIEYIFCDTECELPETYEYLDKIEVFFDKPITRLKPYMSFDNLYEFYKFLPSPMRRWCTIEMKTKIFRKYVYEKLGKDNDGVLNLYIGIRGDEGHRNTNIDNGTGIVTHFPFKDHGVIKKDVEKILIGGGIGYPDYYKWRSRSGCYFCFFQRKIEWIGLYENHPDLFKKAMDFEEKSGKNFNWCQSGPLADLVQPESIKKIKAGYEERVKKNKAKIPANSLFDTDEDSGNNCILCHI